jgi:hypothetical protein
MKKLAKENLSNKELRPIYFEEMKKLELTISYLASHFSDIELAELVPISDKLLGEYVGYYYSKHSILVERAKEKGISVLVVDSQYDEACCELIGLKPLSDIKDKLARKYFVKRTDNDKGKRILKNCASYMEFLSKLTEDLQKRSNYKSRPNANIVDVTKLKELEERYKRTAEGLDMEFKEDGCGDIKYTYGNLAFGENEREEVTAWQSMHYTVLNLNNDLVKTLIETERLDLIEETLIHEFTHLLGCHYHDEAFVSTYNTILDETLKWKARNTAIFETTAQVNSIGEKYQQASTKIPKEAIVKLEIKKGQKIRVIVEKAEDSEEEANENLAKKEEEDKNHKEGLGSLFS